MSKHEVQTSVSFADGKVLACERTGSTVLVHVKTWNEKLLRVHFNDAQALFDLMPGEISGLYYHESETELMRRALKYTHEEFPIQHAYKHFVFTNNDDEPCLEVVAAQIEILSV